MGGTFLPFVTRAYNYTGQLESCLQLSSPLRKQRIFWLRFLLCAVHISKAAVL